MPLKQADLDAIEAAVVELAEEVFSKKQLENYTTPIKTDKKDGTKYLEAHTYEMPMVVDAKGKPVKNPEALRIGGGTTGRMKITLKADQNGTNTYVTAYLNGVQVLKLVEYGAGGFGDISGEADDDDVFDASSVPETEESDDEDNGGDDTDNDGGTDDDGDPQASTDF